MSEALLFQVLADTVLALHVALVLFVVGGLACIVVGRLRSWRWVRSPGFRLAHLATIAVVVAESWLGVLCPLTTLEMWLRAQAHGPVYQGRFLEHWLQAVLFWQAPAWAFLVAYTLFGLAVAAAWWWCPPRGAGRHLLRGRTARRRAGRAG